MPNDNPGSIPILRPNAELSETPQTADSTSVRLYNDLKPSVVRIEASTGTGSGFAVGDKGHIVTNYHVVADAREVFVRTEDGLRYRARVTKADDIKDLAELELEGLAPGAIRPMQVGDDKNLKERQEIKALGHPEGVPTTVLSPGTFNGMTTNLGRFDRDQVVAFAQLKFNPDDKATFLKNNLIDANIQIRHGNSGGPLVDNDGKVVGVSVYKREAPEMRAYMVPATDLKTFLDSKDQKFNFKYEYQLTPSLTTSYLETMNKHPYLSTAATAGGLALGARALTDLGGWGKGLSSGIAAYGGLGLLEDYAALRDATSKRDMWKAGLSTLGDSSLLIGGLARATGVGTRTLLPALSSSMLVGAESRLATTIGGGLLGSAAVGASERYLTSAGKVGLALIAIGVAAKLASDLIPNRLVNTGVTRNDGRTDDPFYLGRIKK